MTDPEDRWHLIEQIQRQMHQIQARIDRSDAAIRSLQAERHPGSRGRDSDTHGILSPSYGWRRSLGTFLRILTILGLVFGCSWNLREILQDMIHSPTVTKMTFTLYNTLPLPPISILQRHNVPMLHTERLFKALENGSLTQAYLEGILNGVGIGVMTEENTTVQPDMFKEVYKMAILQYGSLTEAGLAFQREYGITCDELFTFCGDNVVFGMNCCDIFEFLWGFNGLQYVLKRSTIYLSAFRKFYVDLRSFTSIEALQKGDLVEEPGNYQSYWIGISNGVDQTGYDTHSIEVKPAETVNIILRQKSRKLKISKDCVDVPLKLRYFRDYIMFNCFAERCILDKLSLCNISCELPLLQLMNPHNLSGPPCESYVLDLKCWDIILADFHQCETNHGCLVPCNYTEIEYSVTKERSSADPRGIKLFIKYDSTEAETIEETPRLTQWEYLGLISSVLDLWLGITIFSLHIVLFRGLSKIIHCITYDFGVSNWAVPNSSRSEQQHGMANSSTRKEIEGFEVQ